MSNTNTKIVASTKTEAMELFEMTGFPKDIQAARSLIEDIIYRKCGKVHCLGRSKTQIHIMFFSSHFIVIFCHLLVVKFRNFFLMLCTFTSKCTNHEEDCTNFVSESPNIKNILIWVKNDYLFTKMMPILT